MKVTNEQLQPVANVLKGLISAEMDTPTKAKACQYIVLEWWKEEWNNENIGSALRTIREVQTRLGTSPYFLEILKDAWYEATASKLEKLHDELCWIQDYCPGKRPTRGRYGERD